MPRAMNKEDKKKDESMDCNCGCHCHRHHHYGKMCGGLGGLWFAGWLFTIGLLKLSFWKAVLAIVIWAYYLGAAAAHAWGF